MEQPDQVSVAEAVGDELAAADGLDQRLIGSRPWT